MSRWLIGVRHLYTVKLDEIFSFFKLNVKQGLKNEKEKNVHNSYYMYVQKQPDIQGIELFFYLFVCKIVKTELVYVEKGTPLVYFNN